MKIKAPFTDKAVLQELGKRLNSARLARNLTQIELAREAGVSKRTVERLESGMVAVQLGGFLRVCRALGLLERFDALIPEPIPSPISQLKLRGKARKRASRKPPAKGAPKKWAWGEKT